MSLCTRCSLRPCCSGLSPSAIRIRSMRLPQLFTRAPLAWFQQVKASFLHKMAKGFSVRQSRLQDKRTRKAAEREQDASYSNTCQGGSV